MTWTRTTSKIRNIISRSNRTSLCRNGPRILTTVLMGGFWRRTGVDAGASCSVVGRLTRDDADILCQFHDAWVAELDHPGINYWLKAELLKMTEPGQWNQFWLGAKTTGRHDPDHNQGEWN